MADQAILDERRLDAPAGHEPPDLATETKKTFCRICMVQCGVSVEVAGDRVVRIKGDFEHPLTRGYTCPKGRAMGQVLHHPDAIDRPLMRKDGVLVPVSWDEALDDVAAKLRATIDAFGPHSVGIYFGSGLGVDSAGYAMEDAFYAALGTPPKFSPLTNDGTAKTMLVRARPAHRLFRGRAAGLHRHQSDGQPRPQHRHVQPRDQDQGSRAAGRSLDDRSGADRDRAHVDAAHRALSGQGLRDPRTFSVQQELHVGVCGGNRRRVPRR